MLVTFTTKYQPDIIMFGDVGLAMLKMMGQSNNVPGAILAEDVPAALSKLNSALSLIVDDTTSELDDTVDEETVVNLSTRALPLVELLNQAIKQNSDLMWK